MLFSFVGPMYVGVPPHGLWKVGFEELWTFYWERLEFFCIIYFKFWNIWFSIALVEIDNDRFNLSWFDSDY